MKLPTVSPLALAALAVALAVVAAPATALAADPCGAGQPASTCANDTIEPTADTAPAGTPDVDPNADQASDPIAHAYTGAADEGPPPTSEDATDYATAVAGGVKEGPEAATSSAPAEHAPTPVTHPTAVLGATQAPASELPFTGFDQAVVLALVGMLALVAGITLRRVGARR